MAGDAWLFAGSLAAILGIFLLVKSGEPDSAFEPLTEALAVEHFRLGPSGFSPKSLIIDEMREAALAVGRDGRCMALRRHGAHYLTFPLDHSARVSCEGHELIVAQDQFELRLALGQAAPSWDAILRESLA